jgi:EAL domain-containing protein (putative c-di-GMP-specific phosphodiesterase class I)
MVVPHDVPRQADAAPHEAWPTAAQVADALDRGAIRAEFQPKVALANGALIGVEALARWTDAALGPVPPDRFIPVAEQHGLIGRLTLCVLRRSLDTCAQLRRIHPQATMAVNISPVLLDNPELPGEIAAELAAAEMSPAALVAEVTETRAMGNPAQAEEVLTRLRRLGVGCAIDDFGTGHANLLSLLRLPFTELKIDRAFIARCAYHANAWKIVRATIRLARELGLRVVAEGIEEDVTARLLRDEGCDEGQGYRFGRPMPTVDLLQAVASIPQHHGTRLQAG